MRKIVAYWILNVCLLGPFIAIAQLADSDQFSRQVEQKVLAYNTKIRDLGVQIKEAKLEKSGDTSALILEVKQAVKDCFQVPQEFIRQNPSSLMAINALKMLGNGGDNAPVSEDDLNRLFHSLALEVKQSAEGKNYALMLKNLPMMNKLRAAAIDPSAKSSLSYRQADLELMQLDYPVELELSVPGTQKLREEMILEKLKSATLVFNMAFRNKPSEGIKINAATGYLISETGIAVTNYHVIKEYSSKSVYESLTVMTADGKSFPVLRILTCSEINDLALVQIDTRGAKLQSLSLGKETAVDDPVFVLGHPRPEFFIFTKGRVTENKWDVFVGQQCRVMNISAEFNKGSSGGPIVDECGNVVGTVSRRSDEGVKTGIPVSELKKLIEFKK